MTDMFHNYDCHIDEKERIEPLLPIDKKRELISDNTISLIIDALGNEIGVQVKKDCGFTLYFEMTGCVEGSSIKELVENSTVNFQVIDYWHQVQIDKTFQVSSDLFEDNTLKITVSQAEAEILRAETYFMLLTLTWPGGKYDLFTEKDAKLTIK